MYICVVSIHRDDAYLSDIVAAMSLFEEDIDKDNVHLHGIHFDDVYLSDIICAMSLF